MIKLSIIVPLYNNENTIGRCIESILNQSFKDFELIIVNDGSNDRSEEKCWEYAKVDSRIVIYSKANAGVSSARNYGISKAKGKYITFVDADDYLKSECYEKVNSIEKNEDLIFYHYTIEENGNRTLIYNKKLKKLIQAPDDLMLLYEKGKGCMKGNTFFDETISVFVWRIWFSREYINYYKITFDENLKYGEDRIFLQEALVNCPKIQVCEDVFGYVHTITDDGKNLTKLKDLTSYNPWLYEQQKNMDKAEMNVCKKSALLSRKDLNTIRLKRANAMRKLIVINEFKYNKNNARNNFKKYYKDDFFRWSYNFYNLFYSIQDKDWKEVTKILLIQFKCYKLLEFIYTKL